MGHYTDSGGSDRRTFLRAAGAAGVAGLAGCLGGGGEESNGSEATDTAASDTDTESGGTETEASGTDTEASETDTEVSETDTEGSETDTEGSDTESGGTNGTEGTESGSASLTFGGDGEINMGVSPSVPQDNLIQQYGPIRDRLQSYVTENYEVPDGFSASMFVGNNYSAIIQALGQGTADIAETGPFAAALGVKSGDADVILQRKGYGSWTYVSQIATAPDSDIEELSDLSGKRVSFSDRLSTSGCLYPLYDMKTEGGVDIGDLPEGTGANADIEATFAGGHPASYELLANGRVDAAAMGGFVPGIIGEDTFEGNARLFHKHEGLPRAPIVVSTELGDTASSALQQAFLEASETIYLGADGEADGDDEENPDDLWFTEVREANVDTYGNVIDVANELGVNEDIFQS
jgi:phosphonate transport system substrate-binding protein